VLPKRDEASPARESSACHATTAYQGHAERSEASLPTTGSKSNPGSASRPVGRQRFFASLRMTPYWRRGVEQRPKDPPGASPRLGNTPRSVGTRGRPDLVAKLRLRDAVLQAPACSLHGLVALLRGVTRLRTLRVHSLGARSDESTRSVGERVTPRRPSCGSQVLFRDKESLCVPAERDFLRESPGVLSRWEGPSLAMPLVRTPGWYE
jgi:hypothetical protein